MAGSRMRDDHSAFPMVADLRALAIAAIMLAVIIVGGCAGAAKPNEGWADDDRERDGYEGRVRYVKVEKFAVSDEGGVLAEYDGYLAEERAYTEDGWLKEWTSYGEDGGTMTKIVATFDAAGRKTADIVTGFDGAEIGKSLYLYDGAGLRVRKEDYREGVLFQATDYIRDSAAPKSRVSKYAEGKEYAWTELVYDKDWRLVSTKDYAGGSLERSVVYEYEGAGRILRETSYDADGRPQKKVEYAYDPEGELKESKTYFPVTILSSRMAYLRGASEASKRVEFYDEAGALNQRIDYTEDAQGNVLSTVVYRASPDGLEMVPAGMNRYTYIYW